MLVQGEVRLPVSERLLELREQGLDVGLNGGRGAEGTEPFQVCSRADDHQVSHLPDCIDDAYQDDDMYLKP